MPKYTAGPAVVEAVQFWPADPWPEGFTACSDDEPRPRDMGWGWVVSGGRRLHVCASDWIVRHGKGNDRVYRDDVFRAVFEPVED